MTSSSTSAGWDNSSAPTLGACRRQLSRSTTSRENFDLLTAFPLAQSVKGVAGTELGTARTENVINTSERSWSETDLKSLVSGGKVSLGEDAGDQRGPITIGCRWRWMRRMLPPPRLPALRLRARRYGGQVGG